MLPNLYLDKSDKWITFLASFLVWLVVFLLLVMFTQKTGFNRKDIVRSFFSGVFAWVLAYYVKGLIPTIRPFYASEFPPLTITIPLDTSFPSTHTALAFGMSFYLFLVNKKLGIIFLVLASLVGVGRILSHVHFPIDVVGGAILGIFSSLLLDFLVTKGYFGRGKS